MAQLPVRLKYVESDTFSPGGGVTGVENTVLTAKVKNIAFAKEVALVSALSGGAWTERPLAWQEHFGDYDTFAIYSGNTFYLNDFALRYTVDGQTFWDNNGGANYHLDELGPNTVGGNVVLNLATARRGTEAGGGFVFTTSWVEGEIYVNNLSFTRQVGIRLTANGWASFQDTDASFYGQVPVAEGVSRVETWKFKTPEYNLDESTPDFQFAIYYHDLDTGRFFWDNNFGQDYTLSKTDLAFDK
jgi:hypothetical protein